MPSTRFMLVTSMNSVNIVVVVCRMYPHHPLNTALCEKTCNFWPSGDTVFPAVQIWLCAGGVHAAERTSCHSSSLRWSLSRRYQGQALCCSVENGIWLCTPTTVSHLMFLPVSQLCYTTCWSCDIVIIRRVTCMFDVCSEFKHLICLMLCAPQRWCPLTP